MSATSAARRDRYHHGDLPAALRAAALELVAQRGVGGFSLAEAARRAGVSSGAPYRHYRDREALLADIARDHWEGLADRFASLADVPASSRVPAMARAYVLHALDSPAASTVALGSGLDKDQHPGLAAAAGTAEGMAMSACAEVAGPGLPAAHLMTAVFALAQGLAVMSQEAHAVAVAGDLAQLASDAASDLVDAAHRRRDAAGPH